MKKRRVKVYRITGYKRVFDNVTECKRELNVTIIKQKFIDTNSKVEVITTFPNCDIDELKEERIDFYESRNKTKRNN